MKMIPGLKNRINEFGHRIAIQDVKHIKNIKANLERGLDYKTASPMIPIDREDAAMIMNLSWDDLETDEQEKQDGD